MNKWLLLIFLILAAACTGRQSVGVPTATVDAGSQAALSEPTSESALPAGFDVQGHRGARGLKPENTLPAFETALDLGVTTLEVDLLFSADEVVVIWHDVGITADKCRLDPAATEPLPPDPDQTGLPKSALRVRKLTFDQLNGYRCDRNPEPADFPEQNNDPTALAGDRYQIISLAGLFDFVLAYTESEQKTAAQRANAAKTRFNLETKRKPNDPSAIDDGFDGQSPGPFERAIVAVIEDYGFVDRVTIQSFDHRSLWAVRQLKPEIQLSALTTRNQHDPPSYAAQGAAIWSPNAQDLTTSLLQSAHGSGLLVIPWTVNDPEDMRALIALGVDGLITDRPDLLVNLTLP